VDTKFIIVVKVHYWVHVKTSFYQRKALWYHHYS